STRHDDVTELRWYLLCDLQENSLTSSASNRSRHTTAHRQVGVVRTYEHVRRRPDDVAEPQRKRRCTYLVRPLSCLFLCRHAVLSVPIPGPCHERLASPPVGRHC